jgi:hypothetical protein
LVQLHCRDEISLAFLISAERVKKGPEQCPGRSGLRRPRRSATRHRLCDRCQGRARRQSRRRLPRQFARSDHLPGGGDCERQAGDDAISGVSALHSGQIDIRGLRLLGASKAHILIEDVAHRCPLLAQSGHAVCTDECPLSGLKRTSRFQSVMSGFDPKRTLVEWRAVGGTAARMIVSVAQWPLPPQQLVL